VDLSTGEFVLGELTARELEQELARLSPAELLLSEAHAHEDEGPYRGRREHTAPAPTPPGEEDDAQADADDGEPTDSHRVVTKLADVYFTHDNARRRLLDHFGAGTLAGFGCEDLPLGIGAAGAILAYLEQTHQGALAHIGTVRRLDVSAYVSLDPTTIRNLELVETSRDRRKAGSLLGTLDRTRTSMGARLLRAWILRPLRSVDEINLRQGAVAELVEDMVLRESARETLQGVQDIERLAARTATGRANARDLQALAESLQKAPGVADVLEGHTACGPTLSRIAGELRVVDPASDSGAWVRRILETLSDAPPTGLRDGGLIRDGVDAELDRLRKIRGGGKQWIAALQQAEAKRTGIPNLKIGYNKVFGYYLEVTKSHQDKVPDDYIRKQTLTNAERYVTPDLKEREAEVLSAEEKIVDLEYDLFTALREECAAHVNEAQRVAAALAELDVYAALAEVAVRSNYACPQVDDSATIEIEGGRHPMLVAQLPRGEFVPNDLELDGDQRQIVLVTGPNMSGKSTYIRSAALWVLMAQMGSFVPADRAHIGVADKLFTRVGASDDLGRGQSTFMVEMVETAYILNSATDRSLVVLDEIGRGTSTFDGVAIAWSVVEALHEREGMRPRTLFATHYHELTELAQSLPRVQTCNVAVREWQGEITFLHKIVPGAADRSYGIHVAKLAGVPADVVARAWEILEVLEKRTGGDSSAVSAMAERARRRKKAVGQVVQLPLFGAAESEVARMMAALDTDALTPLEALQQLVALKQKAQQEIDGG
jgi:DNA mismatch repair protein MutS